MDTPLSNTDVAERLSIPVSDVLTYPELKHFESIDELLPGEYSFRILLLEDKRASGHWVCVLRQKNKIYYFNSYGSQGGPDEDLHVVSRAMRKILGEDSDEFTRLLNGKTLVSNSIKFQGDDSQTCGRYAVMAAVACCQMRTPFDVFIKWLQRHRGSSADAFVLNVVQ